MKNTKRNKINLIFSSFLVIGYIICTYFFSMMAEQVSGTLGTLIQVLIMVVFGLLLFYATRVGEGRQVKRFSLAVLLVVVVPSCYIILAGLIDGLPFHDAIASTALIGSMPAILTLACIALGYGIPYTFVSGYEIAEEWQKHHTMKNHINSAPELNEENYPYMNRVFCKYCGSRLRRLINKNSTVTWICDGLSRNGKAYCKGIRVPDDKLKPLADLSGIFYIGKEIVNGTESYGYSRKPDQRK